MLTLGGRAADSQGTVAGVLLGLVATATGLATAFGLSLTTVQQAAITAAATAVLAAAPLVGSLFDHSRRQVAARAAAASVVAASAPERSAPDPVAKLDQKIQTLETLRELVGAGNGSRT